MILKKAILNLCSGQKIIVMIILSIKQGYSLNLQVRQLKRNLRNLQKMRNKNRELNMMKEKIKNSL